MPQWNNIEVSVLVVLVSLLCAGIYWWHRRRRAISRRRWEEEQSRIIRETWQIYPLDIAEVTRRLKSHLDYVEWVQARPKHPEFRDEFMLMIHEAIAGRTYLRKARERGETERI